MRLLADENVPRAVLSALIRAGHDVAAIGEAAPGSPDEAVVARAAAERRIILTFDKDFGDLAFRAGLAPSSGVVLVRFPLATPEHAATRITSVLTSRHDWAGHFAVVERDRIRMRPLPPARGGAGAKPKPS